MAEKPTYLLIDSQVLPDVFLKVVRAKEMLARGTVKSAAMAARACGISRSAFYKYKDSVELFDRGGGSMITLYFSLADEPGVLSAVLSCIYDAGANILTINQNIAVFLITDNRFVLVIILVFNITDDLLQQIFNCYQTVNSAVIINHGSHMNFFLLHFLKQIQHPPFRRHKFDFITD